MLLVFLITLQAVTFADAENFGMSIQGDYYKAYPEMSKKGDTMASSLTKRGWKMSAPPTSKKELIHELQLLADGKIKKNDEVLMSFSVHGMPASRYRSHTLLLPDCTYLSLDDPELVP